MRSTLFPEARHPQGFFSRVAELLTPGVSVHHGHMLEIRLTSWSTAEGVWAIYDYVERAPGRTGFHGYGHYHETYVKHPSIGWRIDSFDLRKLRVDRFRTGAEGS